MTPLYIVFFIAATGHHYCSRRRLSTTCSSTAFWVRMLSTMEKNSSLTDPCRGVTRPSVDGVRRLATEHVAGVFRLDGSPKGDRKPGANDATGLTTEYGVLYIFRWAGTVLTSPVPNPGHSRQIRAEHTVSGEYLRRGNL